MNWNLWVNYGDIMVLEHKLPLIGMDNKAEEKPVYDVSIDKGVVRCHSPIKGWIGNTGLSDIPFTL